MRKVKGHAKELSPPPTVKFISPQIFFKINLLVLCVHVLTEIILQLCTFKIVIIEKAGRVYVFAVVLFLFRLFGQFGCSSCAFFSFCNCC